MRRLTALPPRRSRAGAALLATLLLGAIAAVARPAAAATPASGTLSFAHPSLTWTGSGLSGSAPKQRQVTCTNEATACDSFTLHIDTRQNGVEDPFAVVSMALTPDSMSSQSILLYDPTCKPSDSCYSDMGTSAVMGSPKNGDWTVRVACTACANGSYSLKATLQHVIPDLPSRGDASQQYVLTHLPDPPVDPNQLTTQYGEPAIWMNKHGYGIVNTFGPTVWITKDAGRSWSKSYDILDNDSFCPSGYAGDADAVVGIDDTFYADNLCVGTVGGINNEVFVNSDKGDPGGDKGPNWKGPYLAGGDSDRQWLAPDPTDPNVIYFSYHDLNAVQNIEVYKSTDKGQTWFCPQTNLPAETGPCPVTVMAGGGPAQTYPDSFAGNVTTRGMVDPKDHNSIYMAYADSPAAKSLSAPPTRLDTELSRFRMAVSHDGGHSWMANTDSTGNGTVLDANDGRYFPVSTAGGDDNVLAHIFIASAMDTQGGLYALFSLRLGGHTETHIYLMTSTDHGLTWSAPHQVDSGDINSAVFPAIAVGDPGRVAMAWYGSKTHDFNDTHALWSMMTASTTDGLSAHPTFHQSRMSGPFPVHGADVCQAGTLCAVTGGNRDLADYQTGAVDPCGWATFVYTDDYSGSGSTIVARQVGGTNLYEQSPCGQQETSVFESISGALGIGGGGVDSNSGSTVGARPGGLPNTARALPDQRGAALIVFAALTMCAVLARRFRAARSGAYAVVRTARRLRR